MVQAAENFVLRSGAVLSDRIRVGRVIGQGAMGVVVEGVDLHDGSKLAVKVLSPERANNVEARKRFVREAEAAIRLSSEHLTRVVDIGELEDGTPYIAMECLVGSTLEEVLLREGPLPIEIAIDFVAQALCGLGEAHRLGLVHRDIKPENLFLAERPTGAAIVKVLDFGAVKDLVAKGTKLTRNGSTMGSPAYMAPEQVRAESIDQRADLWATGVTLYELITGRLPFEGTSVAQSLASILRDPYVPIRSRRSDAPPALEALMQRALSKDPQGRFASADEFRRALSELRTSIPSAASAASLKRTLRMNNVRISRPDPFADTTDMSHVLVAEAIDGSRVRPRYSRKQEPITLREPVRRRSPLVALAFGMGLLGVVAGAVAWNQTRRERAAAHLAAAAAAPPPATAALPPAAAKQAPPPAATVLPVAPRLDSAPVTAPASATAATAVPARAPARSSTSRHGRGR